ncbi:MAG: DUF262 domain-containing protein [Flavobacterium sp.]|nr:MAG: DUF262 domain-containing protein [Flavobacterium sp.]
MKIDASVKTIDELKDFFFIVPDYQREYVWKPEDQVEQFIIDIDNEFEPNIKIEAKNYFIGSIIIVEDNDGNYQVIDGQQRLTTIILSLCAFRDILYSLGEGPKEKIYLQKVEVLLSNYDIASDKHKIRLELQYEESNGFLEKLIKKEPYIEKITASISKMQLAYDKLTAHFRSYLNINPEDFLNFVKYFLTKIDIVVIKSENLSSALKIFETINQRGSSLNAMDLLKNLLFSQAKEEDFQKIKSIWKEITQNLQLCKEDNSPLRFLRYFLMARYYDGIIREDDIYKWIISEPGKASTQYETQPLVFAKELEKSSKRYSDLVVATEYMKDGGLYPNITNIGFINKYKSRQHLILLLALDLSFGPHEIEYLGEQIESFFFFSNTLGIQAKNNERLFANWAGKIRVAKTFQDIVNTIEATMVNNLKDKIPDFRMVFMNINHFAYQPQYRERYVLGRIENTILEKSNLPIKGKNHLESLQIEHILPQTPKDGILPEEFDGIDDYRSFVYKLGNVTLLEGTINQAVNNCNDMSAQWFENKQLQYVKSDVTTTKLLNHEFFIGSNTALNRFKADYSYSFMSWNKTTIGERQRILMDLAFETWKFNGVRIDK